MEPSEYERIFEHEGRHFWYRGLHALVLGTLRRELDGRAPSGAARTGAARTGALAAGTAGAGEARAACARAEILDAGCGPGGLTAAMTAHGRVTGFDWSAHALELASRRGLPRLLRASVSAVPFADARFDAVVSCDVLYHRGVADDGVALAELARVCRPGGIVLLNLPAHAWMAGRHDRQVHTARRYSRADVQRLAARAQLDVVRIAWFNCALLPAAALVRWSSRGGDDRQSDVRALPAAINGPLAAWMLLEARAARAGLLPWGLSAFAVLRKPA